MSECEIRHEVLSVSSPVKYCFFMTGNPPWFDLAKALHEKNIATPVLWLGDDRHYTNARNFFGESVVRMLDFVHRPYDLPSVDYRGEFSHFFYSEDYLDAKDICLKMMDRLDLNGVFSRIDREVYFHTLVIWSLKFFSETKPDAVLMIEKPHSHAQYLIYRVAKYLSVPTAHFKDCALFPVNFLQLSDGSFLKKSWVTPRARLDIFERKIDQYVSRISQLASNRDSYAPHYMLAQRKNSQVKRKLVEFLLGGFKPVFREVISDIKLIVDGTYRPTNPYKAYFFSRLYTRQRRVANLKKANRKAAIEEFPSGRYVYFPLHYEPERTTNPDGEAFHDQFKALVALRSFLPNDVDIVVKEHPSQFMMAQRGSRGRSPLFYDLIKKVSNVRFVGSCLDSIDLIRQCEFVATITGSVALEAALMGKRSVVFGKCWFAECPNTYQWDKLTSYEAFSSSKILNAKEVGSFLKKLIAEHAIPMVNNMGQLKAYKTEWYTKDFEEEQLEDIEKFATLFFHHIQK